MANKNQLPKELEEQIQSVASDVYIQIEDKLTHLISAAIETGVHEKVSLDQDDNFKALNKNYQESLAELKKQERKLAEQQQKSTKEAADLQAKIKEYSTDLEAQKQSFQVELTQNTINYTETIEQLEHKLANVQNEQSQQKNQSVDNSSKLQEKLLETEQKLKDQKQAIDGLNGRISVLTEQEQRLLKQIATLTSEKDGDTQALQAELTAAQQQVNAQADELIAQKKQADALNEKLTSSTDSLNKLIAENKSNLENQEQQTQKAVAAIQEQLKAEQNNNAELQQQLSAQQKTLDTQLDSEKKMGNRA